jgi:hypothetical protein
MSKHAHIAAALLALMALATAWPMNPHAQGREELKSEIPSDTYAQSDRQSDMKQALKLSADQEKLWAPVEEALKNLQEQRRAFRSAMTEAEPTDQMEQLRRRAELIAQRADGWKKVADAVQPLWSTLSEQQKRELSHILSLTPGRTDQYQRRTSRRGDDDVDIRYRDRGRSSRHEDEDRSYRDRRDQESGERRGPRDRMKRGRDEDGEDDREDARRDRFDGYSRRWSHDDYPPRARRFERDRYDFNRRSDRDYCRCDRRD